MSGAVQNSCGTDMIHDKCKSYVEEINVTMVRSYMDHMLYMGALYRALHDSWILYDPGKREDSCKYSKCNKQRNNHGSYGIRDIWEAQCRAGMKLM